MMPRIVKVTAVAQYRLHVEFDDGVAGTIDLSAELDGEVFQPLRDEAVFRQVRVDEFGAVCWPNGPDLAPDAMHTQLAREPPCRSSDHRSTAKGPSFTLNASSAARGLTPDPQPPILHAEIPGNGSAVSQRKSAGCPRFPATKRFHDLMTSAARTTSWTRLAAIECKPTIFFCISSIGLNLPAHFPLCHASANIAALGVFAL
jgi:uncharacterized protein DUF2442